MSPVEQTEADAEIASSASVATAPEGAGIGEPPSKRRPQPALIRVAHWVNVPALVVMAASGLQILVAYPRLGPRGQSYGWYPFQGREPPSWLTLGDGLAAGRAFHFATAWILIVNAVVYLAYLTGTGEWRRRFFLPWRDAGNAVQTVAYYLRIRRTPPTQGLYNGLQRAAYTSALLLGALEISSGLAIYKPVQLQALASVFGGYDGARAVHLLGLMALVLFTCGHLALVALHPATSVEMITGGSRRV